MDFKIATLLKMSKNRVRVTIAIERPGGGGGGKIHERDSLKFCISSRDNFFFSPFFSLVTEVTINCIDLCSICRWLKKN